MKTPSNIAVTTLALRELLLTAMPPCVEVTTLTPAVAEQFAGTTGCLARVNVSLLALFLPPHGKNLLPARRDPGQPELPPTLAELHYLVTAYGTAGPAEEHSVERLLEAVLIMFYRHPILTPAELQAALPGHAATEDVKIMLAAPTDSELMSLFASCRAQLRPALKYHAQMILACSP
jgi:hypothetical protein